MQIHSKMQKYQLIDIGMVMMTYKSKKMKILCLTLLAGSKPTPYYSSSLDLGGTSNGMEDAGGSSVLGEDSAYLDR
jgi:hypothetical protein